MTNSDFSNGFDTLLSSYATIARFGSSDNPASIELDEFEKSQFLTKAQEEVVVSLYTGRNSSLQSFEETEELRRYLSNLVSDAIKEPITNSSGNPIGADHSYFFTLPEDTWFITYEYVTLGEGAPCGAGSKIEVIPVTQDEYHRLRKNPFRGANNRRALRLDLSENNVEIVSKYTVTHYYVRYLKKIEPIILVDLTADGLTINGKSEATECKLHESLHNRILDRAVELALQSKGYTVNRDNENK